MESTVVNISLFTSSEGAWYQLLLQTPLNIIYRLFGYNKTINKLLLNEYLWRMRNEKEFGTWVPHRITNHRIHNLVRSKHCYGRLYLNGVKDETFTKVYSFQKSAGQLIINNNHHAVIAQKSTNSTMLVKSNMLPMMNVVTITPYLIVTGLPSKKQKIFYWSSYNKLILSEKMAEKPILDMYYSPTDSSYEFILYADGELSIQFPNRPKVVLPEVLSFWAEGSKMLIVYKSGRAVRAGFNSQTSQWIEEQIPGEYLLAINVATLINTEGKPIVLYYPHSVPPFEIKISYSQVIRTQTINYQLVLAQLFDLPYIDGSRYNDFDVELRLK